jgi:NAD(P)-dependent dehydrogenase (short-subunit alcohol dehydrogenase family)
MVEGRDLICGATGGIGARAAGHLVAEGCASLLTMHGPARE